MSQCIAKSENMNTPSYNIVIINFIHIFPNNFMMVFESKCMNIKFGSSSKDICLGTELFFLSKSKHLNGDCIDGIMFVIGKID